MSDSSSGLLSAVAKRFDDDSSDVHAHAIFQSNTNTHRNTVILLSPSPTSVLISVFLQGNQSWEQQEAPMNESHAPPFLFVPSQTCSSVARITNVDVTLLTLIRNCSPVFT